MHPSAGTWLLLAMSTGCLWSQSGSVGKISPGMTTTSALLSGTVMMEDGSPVPGTADIKLACNASERTVTQTTVNDDFEFQWTRSSQSGQLTSVNTFTSPMSGVNSDASSVVRLSVPEQSVGYCELKASLPGYQSSEINLNDPSEFDGTNVGVLWLRPINPHQGNMVSALTLARAERSEEVIR